MDIQCYGQRMLNPFRGIINVIKYKAAEAATVQDEDLIHNFYTEVGANG